MADTEAVEVNTGSGAIEEPIEPNVSPTTGQKLENLHVRTCIYIQCTCTTHKFKLISHG